MNVKNSFTLSDRYLRYAERMVEDGQFPSVEKVIEAGIDSLMQADPAPTGESDPLLAMKDEIRRRMETPREEFIPMDQDNLFDRVRARIDAKYKAK
ncbi:antitoxin ParD1/3/4 [Neorhizobium sp. 2083]|uniref:hypothetical protein n=1 Tax=Neorhizobium sp. 2083 TaxID=2817762 RepID=UPI002866402A|nr:hypothetical protein [Neorhizobium sp. 2083]MDR6815605.1 antitoxin ParD1/3/4 [Neorhizobium sp. 2083]